MKEIIQKYLKNKNISQYVLSNVKDENNKIDLTKLTQEQIDECLNLVNIYELALTPIIFNQNSFVIICDYLVRKLWFDTLKYFLNKHIKLYQYTITKEKYIDACNLLLNTNRIFELMYLMQLCENYKIDLTQKQYDVIVSYLIDQQFACLLEYFIFKYPEYQFNLYQKENFLNKFYNRKL